MSTRAIARRVTVGTSVAALAASLVATANAQEARLGGANRYETAAEVSEATFPSAETVIVARGRDEFPDALAASYLAGSLQAPILLTETNQLPFATGLEIDRVGGSDVRIIIVGGQNAVSNAVQAELDAMTTGEVVRLGGATRYDTAHEIATFASSDSEGGSNVGTLGSSGRTAVVATGENWPDALSGGALSYQGTFPMVLVRPDALTEGAADTLTDLQIEYAIVLGGQGAMEETVVDQIEAAGIETTRVFGLDRYETATEIADFARTQMGFTQNTITLARGDLFPDALAAGPYAGFFEAPIVLTIDPDRLPEATTDFLGEQAGAITDVTAIGGVGAISEAVLQQAVDAVS